MRRSSTTAISNDDYSGLDAVVCADTASSINASHAQVQAPRTPESTLAPCSNTTPDVSVSPSMPDVRGHVQSSEGEKGEQRGSMCLSKSIVINIGP